MPRVLAVCTGNVCRSPLTAVLLRARIADPRLSIASAGVRALTGSPFDAATARVAREHGAREEHIVAHRARQLRPADLGRADLVLALSRGHRRGAVETDPSVLRSVFTLREFARLARAADDDALSDAASRAVGPSARLRELLLLLDGLRDVAGLPADREDDVVDPHGRPDPVHEMAGAQIAPAVDQVVRVLRAALS
ncbi:low molecular weight phosphatase family protein [Microbacterium betulae]|uniref:protein-tyrosine-phosphatase n=1 Tax=Microbacterium betulae TaxID=2981139 RepID=A0AA97FEQ3_9MICO|nr:low molecular weight phosphatase family protein [Microbacterium sp. AB]WOF22256.1 low molecular weight phosphatase family protein [Microbacterium sp. AB]